LAILTCAPPQERQARWRRVSDRVSFEPNLTTVPLDDTQLRLESGQAAIPHDTDRDLTIDKAIPASSHERHVRHHADQRREDARP
jgi:hypothetical protein